MKLTTEKSEDRIIEKAIAYVEELLKNDSGGHDTEHTLRVYRNALMIADKEPGCDRKIVALAALLHDADDHKLFRTENNANARQFLEENNIPENDIERICQAINAVSFSRNKDRIPETLEESVQHFYDKLLRLKDAMNTETARQIAETRHKFLEEFIAEYKAETEPVATASQEKCDCKNVQIRELRPDETDLLKDFLYEAIFIPEGVNPPDREIINLPELRVYYENFGSGPADHGLVAEADGRVIGAVWTRIMNDYGHVDDDTPSFAISLYKEYRGQGIGTGLMREMLAQLKESGYRKASLAVQKANYAVKMYRNLGFESVDETAEEYIMVCDLSQLPAINKDSIIPPDDV